MEGKRTAIRLSAELYAALRQKCDAWQCNETEAITRVLACSWGVPVATDSTERRRIAQRRRFARKARGKQC